MNLKGEIRQNFPFLQSELHYLSSLYKLKGVLAQLVERLNGIEEVRGSNPLGSTNLSKPTALGWFFVRAKGHATWDLTRFRDDYHYWVKPPKSTSLCAIQPGNAQPRAMQSRSANRISSHWAF